MWIEADKELPDSDKDVLCFTKDQCFVGYRSSSLNDWCMRNTILNSDRHKCDVFGEVTHWMPLPENPGGAVDDEEIEGEIVELEWSGYWGCEVGKVRCPKCESEIGIGGMQDSKCPCGYEWTIETKVVGRKP